MSEQQDNTGFLFVLLPGAYHAPESYWMLQSVLEETGNEVICPDIPSNIAGKTFQDDAEAVIEQINNRKDVYLVAHSRAVEIIPWLVNSKDRDRFIGASLISACGPRYLNEVRLRYRPGFENGIQPIGDGLAIYDRDAARDSFYNCVASEEVMNRAIDLLRPQRLIEEYVTPPSLPKNFKMQAIEGRFDKVHRLNSVIKNIISWAHVWPTIIESDHTPQISSADKLSSLIVWHAIRAYRENVPEQ